MIAITGATGALGGQVARLLARLSPRLVVRDPSRAPHVGGEIRTASYDDGAGADATFTLGRDHGDTEQAIRDAATRTGMTFTLLRDNFCLDVLPYFADASGVIRGPAGDGRVAAAGRPDRGAG